MYNYDAWGKCSTIYSTNSTIANLNPFRYRGYYYDKETGYYYLNSRYYNPEWGRFINADDTDVLTTSLNNRTDKNLFSYCDNNPVVRKDTLGTVWDTVLDIAFIGLDIYNLFVDEGYKDWKNWAALGMDLVFTAIPFATGGGQIVKLANVGDKISDFSKVTVVGETMTRVKTVSQFTNATDNLYDGFKAYSKLSKMGNAGKVMAEVGGKASNVTWLYGKLRFGYRIIDIGIDSTRTIRSSSYIAERLCLGTWKYRNIFKTTYHLRSK